MSHFVVRPQNRLPKGCPTLIENIGSGVWLQDQPQLPAPSFELNCLVQAVQVNGKASLLSRVTYSFRQLPALTGQDALRYAEVLNCLLVHSQVFVIQDIDGDRHYSLQMDTLLSAPYRRRNISCFLDQISQDASLLIQYCQTQVDKYEQVERAAKRAAECKRAADYDAAKMHCKSAADIKINVTNLARVGVWFDNQNS